MTSTALTSLAVGAVLLLSGCGSGGAGPALGESPSESASESAQASASIGVLSPADLPPEPPFVHTPRGVIDDVTVDACDTGPGRVAAQGTATNSAKGSRDVVISISWALPGTGDVLARAIVELRDLAPGARSPWQVRSEIAGDQAASCVPKALSGKLQ